MKLGRIIGLTLVASALLFAGMNKKAAKKMKEELEKKGERIEFLSFVPEDIYVGFGISSAKIGTFDFDEEQTVDLMSFMGYNIHKYVAVELRSYMGITEGENYKHTGSMELFIKPQYPYGDYNFYALLGYGTSQVEYVGKRKIQDMYTSQRSVGFGLGVSYDLDYYGSSVFLDATQLIDASTQLEIGQYDIRVFTINTGLMMKF